MTVLRTALADRYSIEREIGAGGMATVYLARDVKHDRQVAMPQMVGRTELRMSLLWDPLRADPEFKALLASFPR